MASIFIHSGTKQKEAAHMETRAATVQRVYQDFVPSHNLVQVEGIDTLIIELPEFKKEQIRAQLDNFGKLRLSGERPLGDNRWSRFRKDFQLPKDYNVSEIRAKFENGRLYVKLTKLVTEATVKDRPTQAQKPKEEPKSSTGKDDMNQKATSRPSVEPNGVPGKQQDEKRGEPTHVRKDAKKVGEKDKDQTEEKKDKERVKPIAEPKPSIDKDEMNQKATSRPSVEPNGVPKKQEDEKRGEPTDIRKDAKKPGERAKDRTEEKEGEEKVASDVKHEEGEKGGAMADVPKKEEATTEHAAPSSGQNGLGMLKLKIGDLGLDSYKPRQLVINVIAAAGVLVGVGLYVTHKLRSPKVEDGH